MGDRKGTNPVAADSIAMKPFPGPNPKIAISGIQVEETEAHDDGRRSSAVSVQLEDLDTVISTLITLRDNSLAADISPHRGIYWPTVRKMVCCFAFGFICSIAHGGYYGSLDGTKVGSSNDQQRDLRYVVASSGYEAGCLISSTHREMRYPDYLGQSRKHLRISCPNKPCLVRALCVQSMAVEDIKKYRDFYKGS